MSRMVNVPQAVGPLGSRYAAVRRIAVLRGGGLGDVLFAMPALWALSEAYPEAEIVLLGTPLHAALFRERSGPVHRVEVLPAAEGVRDGDVDPGEVERFLTRMRAERFDLAVQLHGGGRFSNPFLLGLGATHSVGTRTRDAAPLERNLPYLYHQHEVLRALEVVGLVGASTAELSPRLPVMDADISAAAEAGGRDGRDRPSLVLHPGASDARRRWGVASFAQVAAWALEDGFDVDVVGDAGEADLAAEVVAAAGREAAGAGRDQPAAAVGPDAGRDLSSVRPYATGPGRLRSLAGRLSLPALVGVMAAADVVVADDSGPRHLAQAVGTSTVGIYWAGNALMASPLGRARHRIHIGWTTHCPVCGVDVTQVGWTAQECEHTFPLVDSVRAQDVYADVLDLADAGWERGRGPRRPRRRTDHGHESS